MDGTRTSTPLLGHPELLEELDQRSTQVVNFISVFSASRTWQACCQSFTSMIHRSLATLLHLPEDSSTSTTTLCNLRQKLIFFPGSSASGDDEEYDRGLAQNFDQEPHGVYFIYAGGTSRLS
ncbi:hypothetical protein WG66_006831 [Moniliophthora roreri]|uniref:Uncharacterized protein n=1 Tax=Moniliophthora roreri TaxID=221103 RepID=A0A0W0FM26_MONRR|nr:hypothetical protein WG66_006831 [Moniliophthora roreri]